MGTPSVIRAEPLGGYRLWLEFSDGKSGEVDLEERLWGPAFERVRDPRYFGKVRVDTHSGTVVWPNGADFAPETLYEEAVGSSQRPAGGVTPSTRRA